MGNKRLIGKIRNIHSVLQKEYGSIKPWKLPPIDSIVNVILSQNTNDLNSGKAFKKLKAKFKRWDGILTAPSAKIASTIRVGGLANIKATRIKKALTQIKEKEGKLDISFLSNHSPADARNYLMQFDGIGPKSAAVVVAFAFGKPSFPIDTHVFRVIRRIPLIPKGMSYENAHEFMEKTVPDGLKIPLHMQIIAHGRKTCRAGRPLCQECILRRECRRIGV